MEQVTNKPAALRRNKEQIAGLLKLHECHTGTTKDFCKAHNISEGAFYAARKRHSVQSTHTQQPGAGFTALTQPAFKTAHASLFAEVGEIRIYQAVAPGYLKALLP